MSELDVRYWVWRHEDGTLCAYETPFPRKHVPRQPGIVGRIDWWTYHGDAPAEGKERPIMCGVTLDEFKAMIGNTDWLTESKPLRNADAFVWRLFGWMLIMILSLALGGCVNFDHPNFSISMALLGIIAFWKTRKLVKGESNAK